MTVTQVKALDPGESEYKAKLYFGEWLSLQNDVTLISRSAEELRADMYITTGTKELKAPEPKKLPNAA